MATLEEILKRTVVASWYAEAALEAEKIIESRAGELVRRGVLSFSLSGYPNMLDNEKSFANYLAKSLDTAVDVEWHSDQRDGAWYTVTVRLSRGG